MRVFQTPSQASPGYSLGMTPARKSPLWDSAEAFTAWCGKQGDALVNPKRRSRRPFIVGRGLFGLMALLLVWAMVVFVKFGLALFAVGFFLIVWLSLMTAAVLHQGAIHFGEWRFERKYPRTAS